MRPVELGKLEKEPPPPLSSSLFVPEKGSPFSPPNPWDPFGEGVAPFSLLSHDTSLFCVNLVLTGCRHGERFVTSSHSLIASPPFVASHPLTTPFGTASMTLSVATDSNRQQPDTTTWPILLPTFF